MTPSPWHHHSVSLSDTSYTAQAGPHGCLFCFRQSRSMGQAGFSLQVLLPWVSESGIIGVYHLMQQLVLIGTFAHILKTFLRQSLAPPPRLTLNLVSSWGWPGTWSSCLHLPNDGITSSAGIYRHMTPHLSFILLLLFWTGLYHIPKGWARTEVILLAHFPEYWGFRYVPPAWQLHALTQIWVILLPQLLGCWDYRCGLLHLQPLSSLHLGSKSIWIYTRHLWNTQFTNIFSCFVCYCFRCKRVTNSAHQTNCWLPQSEMTCSFLYHCLNITWFGKKLRKCIRSLYFRN